MPLDPAMRNRFSRLRCSIVEGDFSRVWRSRSYSPSPTWLTWPFSYCLPNTFSKRSTPGRTWLRSSASEASGSWCFRHIFSTKRSEKLEKLRKTKSPFLFGRCQVGTTSSPVFSPDLRHARSGGEFSSFFFRLEKSPGQSLF